MADISYMSRLAAAAFAAGDFAHAAELAAEARTSVELADPSSSVAQLPDGRLAICSKSALNDPNTDMASLHAQLTKALDEAPADYHPEPYDPRRDP